MPEGPSIVILKEAVQEFKGKKIVKVEGNSKLDIQRIIGQKVTDFKSWGKHFIICFKDFSIRIHLMMFGSYRINEEKDAVPRLKMYFADGTLSFFACSLKFIEGEINEVYDWSSDVMSDTFDPIAAKKKIKALPDELVCDALLNQNIFAGVGNIIKNEVLFRIRLHPETKLKDIPTRKLTELIKEARIYSFDFLNWKKAFVLRKHWLAYAKKTCPRDHVSFIKKHCGRTNRRTFYCEMCQVLYEKGDKIKV